MFEIRDITQGKYNQLALCGKLENDVLYIIYLDKRTCILCNKEFKRYEEFESKIFCPECVLKLTGPKTKGEK